MSFFFFILFLIKVMYGLRDIKGIFEERLNDDHSAVLYCFDLIFL